MEIDIAKIISGKHRVVAQINSIEHIPCFYGRRGKHICINIVMNSFSPVQSTTVQAFQSTKSYELNYFMEYSFKTNTSKEPHEWKLFIFRNGIDMTCNRFVSLILQLESHPLDLPVRVTLTFDQDCLVDSIKNRLMKPNDICLVKKLKPYPSDGDQTLKMAIICSEESPASDMEESNFSKLLFTNTSDLVLSGPGWECRAHREVLTENSIVFKQMFEHNMQESSSNKIDMIDIEEGVIKSMLIYMYTGEAFGLSKFPDKLLIAADRYCVTKLKELCEESLCLDIRVENVSERLHLAELYRCEKLKDFCLDMLIHCLDDVTSTDGWKNIEKDHSLLAAFIAKKQKTNGL